MQPEPVRRVLRPERTNGIGGHSFDLIAFLVHRAMMTAAEYAQCRT
jgi:hypothetical protein